MPLTKGKQTFDITKNVANVLDFGAIGDGVTDDTVAIQAALDASNNVFFPDGDYLITSGVTKVSDDVSVDFGNATIINGGVGYLFTFGTSADTPQNNGLKVRGGNFIQSVPSTTSNQNYILIGAVKDFSISSMRLNNVSNGGITVYAGAEDGVINDIEIPSKSAYSTIRGIWLNGATASDYASQLMDLDSITRNATAVPIYAVKNVKISNCTLTYGGYGIYCMNTRDVTIDNNHIDMSGVGSTRCIALNNYSPGAIVCNNRLISDRSCTGILVTQYSHDVVITGNVFSGSFGGNRAIYVAYLASVLITGNRFSDETTQHIEINTGGFASVLNNEFFPSAYIAFFRVILLSALDATSLSQGSTAGVIANSGLLFKNNTVSNRSVIVRADMSLASTVNENQPCVDTLEVSNNTVLNFQGTGGGEYLVEINTGSSGNVQDYYYKNNSLHPYTGSLRNRVVLVGTDYRELMSNTDFGLFSVVNEAGAGAITSTKLVGSSYSCVATRSANNIIVSPRTQFGTSGASVPPIIGIVDELGTAASFRIVRSSANYTITALDSTGALIPSSTTAIKFSLLIGPSAT